MVTRKCGCLGALTRQPHAGSRAARRFQSRTAYILVHCEFPRVHWHALRTTNPIERVNKELKRRSKSMETIGSDGLKALLAFTAMRLEYGWQVTPVTSNKLGNLPGGRKAKL